MSNPPSTRPVPGIVALVLCAFALAAIGLAGFNAAQAVRIAGDATLPLFVRAFVLDANGRRVLVFAVVATLLVVAGIGLAAFGRRALTAQIALTLLGCELLGVGGVALYARKMPTSTELRARAKAERDEEDRLAQAAPPPAPVAKPKISKRLVAYTLGTVVGTTALGRTGAVRPEIVQRQIARANTLASALGVTVAPFPDLTGKKTADRVAALDYVLDRGGKDLTRDVASAQGADAAALIELGMKMSVARMIYLPRSSTNAAFVAVFDRTSKAASLKTLTIATASAKIRGNAPRADVDDALDAMEDAIKLELTNESNESSEASAANEPVGTTTVTAAELPNATTAPAAPAPAAAAKVAAPKAAVVRGGAADVSGRLPPEVISRTVRANFSRFRACYESGLRSNPELRGRVTTRFVIDRSGSVSTAADNGSDLPDRQVVQCVVRGFSGLSFPQPEGGSVTVSYPISFQPGS